MFKFMLINGATVNNIINSSHAEVIALIARAYLAHENGHTICPDTSFLRFPNKPTARIGALPAYLKDKTELVGIKWIASFPENIQHNIPRASAVVILNDFETGYPLACIEGSIISAARTAASAVLAAGILSTSKKLNRIAFIGNGIIAKYTYDFLIADSWEFENVNLYDINPLYSEKLADYIQNKSNSKVNITDSVARVSCDSQLIVLATTASCPHIYDPQIFSHNPLLLNISLRDLSPEIIRSSHNIVDDIEHCLKASTSLHLTFLEDGNHDFINGTIGNLLAKNPKLKLSLNKPTIYSPFGMGVLDVALGTHIYNNAQDNPELYIDDFFYEQTRW